MDRLERAKKFAVNVSDWWDTHKRMADFAESEVRAERARIAAELRALVVRSNSWDAYADAMEKFIEQLEEQDA